MKAVPLHTLVAGLSLALVAALLWHFHDQFWWPADEGVYAYVAQRMLAGDVIHRDLIDLHGGYGNLANAAAFRLFGEDLVSLRYPLVAATLAEALITFCLLTGRGALVAAAGTVAVGAFSVIQFLNPSANWHALVLFFVTALLLERGDPREARTLILAGLLVGLCFLVRQLSGAILGLGVLTWLLLAVPPAPGSGLAGRAVAGVLLAGLALYLASKASPLGALAFGLAPAGLITLAGTRSRLESTEALRLMGWLALGAALAASPLAAYYTLNGGLGAWLRDIVFTAMLIHDQEFITDARFTTMLKLAAGNLATSGNLIAALNGVFWIALVLAVPAVGVATLVRATAGTSQALPVLATFWGLVALHYQIPIYLFFALPAILPALLALRPTRGAAAAVLALSAWAVVFHAGQPVSRGLEGTIAGRRVDQTAPADLPGVSLTIEANDRAVYSRLLARIAAGAAPGEPLMTLPMEPQLNFITGRRTPVPYYGTPLGLQEAADVADTLAHLEAAAPLFIVVRRTDKYLTPLSARLLVAIRRRAAPPEPIGPFDLYRLPAPGHAALPER